MKTPTGVLGIKILKCARVTLHHQNITAPSHDISITDWRARPPTREWFPSSLLNHPFVQKALILIFKCNSVGRRSRRWLRGNQYRGLVLWLELCVRYRGVGSLNCSVSHLDSRQVRQRWHRRSEPRGNTPCTSYNLLRQVQHGQVTEVHWPEINTSRNEVPVQMVHQKGDILW